MPLYTKAGFSVFYIHVPKTGGSAIHSFFHANGFRAEFIDASAGSPANRVRRCSPQHMHAEPIMAILRPARFDFLFMTVRDPVSRLVSEYKWRTRMTGREEAITPWFRRTARAWIEDRYLADNHIRPQAEFWLPTCEVYRQEDGYETTLVQRLEERTGVCFEHRMVEHRNTGERQSADMDEVERLTPEIRAFYSQDYAKFGY